MSDFYRNRPSDETHQTPAKIPHLGHTDLEEVERPAEKHTETDPEASISNAKNEPGQSSSSVDQSHGVPIDTVGAFDNAL